MSATRWIDAARPLLDAVAAQQDVLEAVSRRFADAIAADGLVHLFGTGHSRIAVEEMFPRYGSYPGFHPVVELSMTFHTEVVGTNGQRQAMFIERTSGLAEVVLDNFVFGEHDVMVVISHSGTNAVPLEMTTGAKDRGLAVVAITSLAQRAANDVADGEHVADHADHVLDLATPAGDALVTVDGFPADVGPGSTLTGVAIVNCLKVRTAELLAERGVSLPVIASASVVGTERSESMFDAAYLEHARRAKRVVRDAR